MLAVRGPRTSPHQLQPETRTLLHLPVILHWHQDPHNQLLPHIQLHPVHLQLMLHHHHILMLLHHNTGMAHHHLSPGMGTRATVTHQLRKHSRSSKRRRKIMGLVGSERVWSVGPLVGWFLVTLFQMQLRMCMMRVMMPGSMMPVGLISRLQIYDLCFATYVTAMFSIKRCFN